MTNTIVEFNKKNRLLTLYREFMITFHKERSENIKKNPTSGQDRTCFKYKIYYEAEALTITLRSEAS